MDERLRGRWMSYAVATNEGRKRARLLLVKIMSERSGILIAEPVNGKWVARRNTFDLVGNKIMDRDQCLFYILDITQNEIRLFSPDKWTIYDMERRPDEDFA